MTTDVVSFLRSRSYYSAVAAAAAAADVLCCCAAAVSTSFGLHVTVFFFLLLVQKPPIRIYGEWLLILSNITTTQYFRSTVVFCDHSSHS